METQSRNTTKRILLVPSVILLAVGGCGGPMILRLYFIHGGSRIWLASWLLTAGWPILFIPLALSYLHRRETEGSEAKLILMKPFLFSASAAIGLLAGADNYLVAFGASKLPVSTSTLISASQLAFTAGFAFLLVKQKFTPYSINAVVLLIIAPVLLALRASSDRPESESSQEYVMGFVMTVAGAALYGFIMPAVELTYAKAKQAISYTLVLEIQVVMWFFATIVCTVGMLINNDFQAIPREATEFGLGETKYYLVLVSNVIIWQLFLVGGIGVVYCASSLLSGILIAVLLPATEILAVFIYHEKFQAEKIVSLLLSLWGFISYFYGEKKLNERKNQIPSSEANNQKGPETEMMSVAVAP